MGVASTPVLRDVEDDTSSLASSFGGDMDDEPKPLLTYHPSVATPANPSAQRGTRGVSAGVSILTAGTSITTP